MSDALIVPKRKLTAMEWQEAVSDVLAAQPELAAVTVNAIQDGILRAQDRQLDRIADLSLGLTEALRTRPGSARRRGDLIVKAIEASTVYPSVWSAEAISREQATRNA